MKDRIPRKLKKKYAKIVDKAMEHEIEKQAVEIATDAIQSAIAQVNLMSALAGHKGYELVDPSKYASR